MTTYSLIKIDGRPLPPSSGSKLLRALEPLSFSNASSLCSYMVWTKTNKQEPHVRRGHPIVFGLILLFSLIEGCITAWLGMSLCQSHLHRS